MAACLVPLGEGVSYASDFLSIAEEEGLMNAIDSEVPAHEWTILKRRRLLNLGGTPHPDGMIPVDLPKWATLPVFPKLSKLIPTKPNHILLNEYVKPSGICAHEDGPLYDAFVAIVSLGSPIPLRFTPKRRDDGSTKVSFSVLLMPRSLIVFTPPAYTEYLHAIPETDEDELDGTFVNLHLCGVGPDEKPRFEVGQLVPRGERRLSLTYRRVKKTSKVSASTFLGKN
jgi:alkylated DNA repair protein alkB homolog 6